MECKLTRPQAELLLANHAGMGHQLWRELIGLVFLDLNMRSQGQLCQLLQQMRSGKLTDAAWQSLEDRVVRTEKTGKPDARLSQPPFSAATNRCIVHRHALRVLLAYSLALKDSIEQEQIFFVLHACDEVPPSDEHRFTADVRRQVLQIPNPRKTGRLPGVLPLYVGMRLCLHNCKDCVRLGLMNGAEVEVVKIIFAPAEWNERAPNRRPGDLNVLKYMPAALVLRAIAAPWLLPDSCQCPFLPAAQRTGTFLLQPTSETFNYSENPGRERPVQVTRTMFPLLPSNVCIVYGAQGESWSAVLADLARPPRMTPEVHWLAVYVMLSRARTLDGILLLRNAEKEQLECGPPEYLVQETERLLKLERQCAAEVQKQLRQIKHLPREIIDMFAPQIAELQRERHHRCMSAAGGACAAAGAPGRRYRGKQPRRRDADKEHAPNANLDTGGSDADEEAEPHASLGAGAGDHTGHMCRQICE